MNSPNSSDSDAANEPVTIWWLAIDEETVGPHSEAYIVKSLSDGSLDSLTLACRGDEHRWRPLRMWHQFAEAAAGRTPRNPPSDRNAILSKTSLWNDRLSIQVRCIGIYCLFVRPLMLCLYLIVDLVTGGIAAETDAQMDRVIYPLYGYLQSLALAAFLIVAGRELLALRRAASYLVPTAIGISAFCFMAGVIATVFALAYSMTLPVDEFSNSQPMTGVEAVSMAAACFMLPLSVMLFCFEIYALTWWFQHVRQMNWLEAAKGTHPQTGEKTNE